MHALAQGGCRERVLKGANQIKVLQTGSKKLKPLPTLCFYYCARKLSDPARDRFSFNYVFHVCVPRLHAQQLLSRPNLSHTSSSPTLNSLPIKTSLHRVCLALVCMYVLYASVQCICVLIIFEGYFPEYKLRHVPCCLLSLQFGVVQCCKHLP